MDIKTLNRLNAARVKNKVHQHIAGRLSGEAEVEMEAEMVDLTSNGAVYDLNYTVMSAPVRFTAHTSRGETKGTGTVHLSLDVIMPEGLSVDYLTETGELDIQLHDTRKIRVTDIAALSTTEGDGAALTRVLRDRLSAITDLTSPIGTGDGYIVLNEDDLYALIFDLPIAIYTPMVED